MAEDVLALGGIYTIRNTVNGKLYVGSAVCFRKRFTLHRSYLNRGLGTARLQNAWRKYGESAFEFTVIEIVADRSALLAREQYWMDKLQVVELGYNIYPTAGSGLGYRHSEERKAAVSRQFKGVPKSAEWRAKASAAQIGRKLSAETRAKMSLAASNRSAEHRKKLSDARKTFRQTPEAKAKIAAAIRGMKRSAETRAKVGDFHRGKIVSAETRAKQSAAHIARHAAARPGLTETN